MYQELVLRYQELTICFPAFCVGTGKENDSVYQSCRVQDMVNWTLKSSAFAFNS